VSIRSSALGPYAMYLRTSNICSVVLPLVIVSDITESMLETQCRRSHISVSEVQILIQNVGTNFADKRLSLGLYSSLADSGHGVSLVLDSYPMYLIAWSC
jgi:hypothetical protein